MRVFELPELGHDEHIVGVNERDPSGEVGHRKVTKHLPRTVTLAARGTEGDTSDTLDDAILENPVVKKAIAERKVSAVHSDPPAPEAPPEDSEPPAAA